MIVVGALKATAPGENNPNCPAEPNMPWFLILGGVGITFLLLVRIALTNIMLFVKNELTCCHDIACCFCEFSCNHIYDIVVMVFIMMWMITVTWWVFRHRIGPTKLHSILGKEVLDSFRASLGDNDTIHDVSPYKYFLQGNTFLYLFQIQFINPLSDSYCDHLLFMVSFVLLSCGWIVLTGALIVFIADKIFYKIVCCRLCKNITHQDQSEIEEDQVMLHSSDQTMTTDL
jgi:hypothetical protein